MQFEFWSGLKKSWKRLLSIIMGILISVNIANVFLKIPLLHLICLSFVIVLFMAYCLFEYRYRVLKQRQKISNQKIEQYAAEHKLKTIQLTPEQVQDLYKEGSIVVNGIPIVLSEIEQLNN